MPSGSRISGSASHAAKAAFPMWVTPEGMVTFFRLPQFSNMLGPMTVRSAGRVTSVSFSHSWNRLSPSVTPLAGSFTEVRPALQNAPVPMEVTPSGMVSSRSEQNKKALLPMVRRLSGRVREAMPLPEKAKSPMAVKPSGRVTAPPRRHFSNAWAPMEVMLLGMVTEVT